MRVLNARDARRGAEIRAYDVLGDAPPRELVAVTELAAGICNVPMATINLLTETEQHQVATVGFDGSVSSIEDSMCAVVLEQDDPVLVPDAREDPRFRDNPYVTGRLANVRFYAAHQLVTPRGTHIGTLCVFDTQPHPADETHLEALSTLAPRVVDVLELSLRSRQLADSLAREQQVTVQLEESNTRLSSFAGQVSHDLKTPLTSISASLELMHDELSEGILERDDALALLERARRGSLRMAQMIDEMLAFATLGGALRTTDVDLGAELDDVLVDLGDELRDARLQVGPLPVVLGDRVQLRAVLQNLIGNAAKFRRPDVLGATIRIASSSTDRWHRVEVIDDGPGVAVENRARLFDPYTRGDEGDDQVTGSGIGLATCRRIIEAHAGRIGLADSPGGGTTAWFELPS